MRGRVEARRRSAKKNGSTNVRRSSCDRLVTARFRPVVTEQMPARRRNRARVHREKPRMPITVHRKRCAAPAAAVADSPATPARRGHADAPQESFDRRPSYRKVLGQVERAQGSYSKVALFDHVVEKTITAYTHAGSLVLAAEHTLGACEALRAAGFPVPATEAVPGQPTTLRQRRARGVQFKELQGPPRARAWAQVQKMIEAAKDSGVCRAYNVAIDPGVHNFFFTPAGAIKAWFDPVVA
jgi:hypothetical protein